MMTQTVALAPDEQALAQGELDKHLLAQAANVAPEIPVCSFDLLALATENILAHAKELASLKENLSKTEYRKLLKQHEWKNEDRRYLKVAAAFKQFSNQDLLQIEPATIFRLANNPKKYQSVIDQLLDSPEITQATVCELIAKQKQPKEPKSEKPSIWRRTRNGGRYCQIPPIHEKNEQTGTTLQQMMDSEGLTAQRIVAEAVALRQAFIEGRLVLVEQVQQTSNDSKPEEIDIEINSNNMASDRCEEDMKCDRTFLSEQLPAPAWTKEPEQKLDVVDCIEGAAELEHKETQAIVPPVQRLIETLQSCSCWQEISQALKVYGEYKQLAWNALTPLERRRIAALTPTEIRKLVEAKKAGKIIDFREIREDVYQVQYHGCLFWEVVSASRLETFLAQL